MTIPAYPAYRASDIDWVGELPLAWAESRLGRLAQIYAGGTPDRAQLHYWRDGTIPWINSGAVNQGVIEERSALITTEAFANSSARWVRPGALVIALAGQGKTKGMVAQMGIAATCNQSMAAIDPADDLRERYLYWWLDSNYRSIRSMGGGDLRDGLNLVHIGGIPVPLPSTVEQRQIADYLDTHTAKIDLLIEKQERLIETLGERRQAVISHAVTKGLDPNAPMKDSGVGWLGLIPVSWSVPRVAHNYSIVLGKMVNAGKDSTPDALETPYLRAGNVQPYGVDITEVKSMPMTAAELAQLSLCLGDLVVVEGGQGGYGRSAIVLEDLSGWGFQNHVMRVRPKPSASNAFLDYVLKTLRSAGYIASLSSHASLPSFSAEKLSAIRYGMPTFEEQEAIVEYLDRETAQIDALSAKAREMINVLNERRQALISAAVTGKIDVRGLS